MPTTQNSTVNSKPVKKYTTIDGKKVRIELIKDTDLPLVLPPIVDYLPTADGKSPLAKIEWKNIRDSAGNIIGFRETDTMPNWAGSSWYYLRYIDPKNDQVFADYDKLKYWLPVDRYYGGGEHTTLHLLYSRFWHRFLYDQKLVPTKEPYQTRINGGILLGPDGSKMSKSKGNIIGIEEKIRDYGADSVRLYIAFIGPYESTVIWNEGGLKACKRLVDQVFGLQKKVVSYQTLELKSNLECQKITLEKDEIEPLYLIADELNISEIEKLTEILPLKVAILDSKTDKLEQIQTLAKNWQINSKEIFYLTNSVENLIQTKPLLDTNKFVGFYTENSQKEELIKFLPKHQILNSVEKLPGLLQTWFLPKEIEKDLLISYNKFLAFVTLNVWENKNNVVVAQIMTFVNLLRQTKQIPAFIWLGFLKVLAPFAPFITEELWYNIQRLDESDGQNSIHLSFYPQANSDLCIEDTITIAVQVNGKVRGTLEVAKDLPEKELLELSQKEVSKWLEDKPLKFSKIIPNKIVSLVV
jgi:leucyl-tRNA synthetase